MSSAIERLLGTRSKAHDVAARVVEILALQKMGDSAREIVHHWAKEFYRLRNDFAHGRVQPQQSGTWNAACHLLLGAIAFPLLVKGLLARHGILQLEDADRRESTAFAQFAADLREPNSKLASWHTYVRDS